MYIYMKVYYILNNEKASNSSFYFALVNLITKAENHIYRKMKLLRADTGMMNNQ